MKLESIEIVLLLEIFTLCWLIRFVKQLLIADCERFSVKLEKLA